VVFSSSPNKLINTSLIAVQEKCIFVKNLNYMKELQLFSIEKETSLDASLQSVAKSLIEEVCSSCKSQKR